MKKIIHFAILVSLFLIFQISFAQAEFEPNQLFVKFTSQESMQKSKSFLALQKKLHFQSQPAFKSKELNTILLIKGNGIENAIKKIKQLPNIEYVERVPKYDFFYTPNDPMFAQQWNLNTIQASSAWNLSQGNSTIKIAITDNAFLVNHQDLASQFYINPNEIPNNGIDDDNNGYIDDWRGWDAADNDNNVDALNPTNSYMTHGTHVAGIVAAATNNNLGIASIGFNCKIIPVKIGTDFGGSLTGAYQGLEYAINSDARVINMSWGGSAYSSTYQILFNLAYQKGIVCVAAAGNSSTSLPMYPASYNHVISVAASDSFDRLASFTNYGSSIDVTAPGVDILSALAGANNSYGLLSGTSMASPLTAGLCALMLSNNSALTPDSVEACLKRNCDNIDAQNPNFLGQFGAGRINAFKALQCTQTAPTAEFKSDFTTQCKNEAINFKALPAGVAPFTYHWTFTGAIPNSSTLANPQVTYSANGTYSVSLTVTNALGSNTITKTNYITIQNPTATLSGNLHLIGANTGYLLINFTGNPPFTVTLTDGINTTTKNNITQNPYSFPVTPTLDSSSYSILFFKDSLCVGDKSGTGIVKKNKTNGTNNQVCLRVKSYQEITDHVGNFNQNLLSGDGFGTGVCNVGDWDGDGVNDLMVGAGFSNHGGMVYPDGGIYFLRMNTNGTVKNYNIIDQTTAPFNGANSHAGTCLGHDFTLVGDINGDGVKDILAGGNKDYTGANEAGSVFVLFMNANGTVASVVKWANGQNGIPANSFQFRSDFGAKMNAIGDWDGDGVTDVAIGAFQHSDYKTSGGAMYIVLINANGTVKQMTKVSGLTSSLLANEIFDYSLFGSVEYLGDINGDGLKDFAVGTSACYNSSNLGKILIISLNSNGTVNQILSTIGQGLGGFTGNLSISNHFGYKLCKAGDIDNDGVVDLIVGIAGEDDGNQNSGGAWILLLNANGTVKKNIKISQTSGNFTGTFSTGSYNGFSVTSMGDLDGNGVGDFAIGGYGENGVKGAVWILFMEDTCANKLIACSKSQRQFFAKCTQDSLPLTVRTGSKYRWSPVSGLSNDTIQNPICFANRDTIYLVNYLDSIGCQMFDTIVVHVKTPANYLPIPDQRICMGDSAQLSIPIFANNITWLPNQNISNNTIKNPFIFPTVSKKYWVSFQDTFGCILKDTIFIKVDTCCIARAKFSLSDSVLCIENSLTIVNRSTFVGSPTFTWNFGTANFIGANPPVVHFSTGGTYSIRLIIDNGICKDTLTKNVFVIKLKPFAGKDSFSCKSNLIVQLGETPNADWQYTWSPALGLNDSTIANPIATISKSTTYIVKVKDNITNCSASDTVILGLKNVLDSSFINQKICRGDSVFFYSQACKKDSTYFHYLPAINGCDSAVVVLHLTVSKPTQQTLSTIYACEKYTNSLGQTFTQNTVFLDTLKSLQGCDSIYISTPLYITKIVQKTVTISGCGEVNFNGKIYLQSQQNIDSTFIKSSLNTNCDSLKIIYNAKVKALPSATISAEISNPVPYGNTIKLIASGGIQYDWNYANATTSTINYTAINNYNFEVKVMNSDSCFATANYLVEVGEMPELLMPTAFSPNGDNLNETFSPVFKGNVQINFMQIFNRWGEMIYEGFGNSCKWDGTYKNVPQPLDVYTYSVSYKIKNEDKFISGNLTLLK